MLDVGREIPGETGISDAADGPLLHQPVQGRRAPWALPAGARSVPHHGPHQVPPVVKLGDHVPAEVPGRPGNKNTRHLALLLVLCVTVNDAAWPSLTSQVAGSSSLRRQCTHPGSHQFRLLPLAGALASE